MAKEKSPKKEVKKTANKKAAPKKAAAPKKTNYFLNGDRGYSQ